MSDYYQKLAARLGIDADTFLLFLYTFHERPFALNLWKTVLFQICVFHYMTKNCSKFDPESHITGYWDEFNDLVEQIKRLEEIPEPFAGKAGDQVRMPDLSNPCGRLMEHVGVLHDNHMHRGGADKERILPQEDLLHSSAHMVMHYIHALSQREQFLKERDLGLAQTGDRIGVFMTQITFAIYGQAIGTQFANSFNQIMEL